MYVILPNIVFALPELLMSLFVWLRTDWKLPRYRTGRIEEGGQEGVAAGIRMELFWGYACMS